MITFSCFDFRNLTLGAKSEVASGKLVNRLEDNTRMKLISLLNGDDNTTV